MPLYEVSHSCPLTQEQRQALATAITDLHCTAFTTPSFFVHVSFAKEDASEGTYFTAAKARTMCSNRIVGILRTSPARSKADYDALAVKIEEAWYQTLKGTSDANGEEAQKLVLVTFTHMLAIREGGMTLPEAGNEGMWFKEQLPYINLMSEQGYEDFTDMLEEMEKKLILHKLLP